MIPLKKGRANLSVAIYTRSIDDFLYSKSSTFHPSGYPRVRVLGSTALGFLLEAVNDENYDFVVSIDEDAYVTRPELLRNLIDEAVSSDIGLVGMPDGGVCPHRTFNPRSVNPFFAIINSKRVRALLRESDFVGYPTAGDGFLDNHPSGFLEYGYQVGVHEPFDEFFVWVADNLGVRYLKASIHGDGTSTVLHDFDGNDFLIHTWFTREFRRDLHHTRRIARVIDEAARVNTRGVNVSTLERIQLERSVFEFRVARKVYVYLKRKFELV